MTSIRALAVVLALSAVPLAIACGSSPSAEVVSDTAPIINGVADPEHPAVISMLMERPGATEGAPSSWSSCTGTIVKTSPTTKIGYVLTAAHCVRGEIKNIVVLQGSDTSLASGLSRYGYLDHKMHPNYTGATTSPYDIAMVRILGVDATTPVIPMTTQDNLVMNSRVTSVGFGRTVRPNAPPGDAGPNTAKNRIDGNVAELTTATMGVRYDNNGDICQGDSGGPVLSKIAGKEYAVGVHSYVTGPCVGIGYSVRASAHMSFLNGIMGAPAPEETCDICKKTVTSGNQVCAQARKACQDDPQCDGLNKCIRSCAAAAVDAGSDAGPSEDCRKACSVEFPFGAAPYNTLLIFCACRECGSTCATDTTCAALPKCGMKFDRDECTACMEGACCAEATKCSADGHCYRCERTPETPGCDGDAMYQELKACRANSCVQQCAPKPEGNADAGP